MINRVQPGQRITAEQYNNLVDAIYNIRARARVDTAASLLPQCASQAGGNTALTQVYDAPIWSVSQFYTRPLMLSDPDQVYIFDANSITFYMDALRACDVQDLPTGDLSTLPGVFVVYCAENGCLGIDGQSTSAIVPPVIEGEDLPNTQPNPAIPVWACYTLKARDLSKRHVLQMYQTQATDANIAPSPKTWRRIIVSDATSGGNWEPAMQYVDSLQVVIWPAADNNTVQQSIASPAINGLAPTPSPARYYTTDS